MPPQSFMSEIEWKAQELRGMLGLAATAVLDPYRLAKQMRVPIFTPEQICGMAPDELELLLIDQARCWSAGALPLPGGRYAVVLNPTHADTRKRATLMEELAHVHLNHKPSQLITLDYGLVKRSFDKAQETEAYWVGAAALVPQALLLRSQFQQLSISEVASYCGVSQALVTFRSNVTHIKLTKPA